MKTSEPVTGVILAGGQSRRMGGGDKGMKLLAGKPMLAHVRDRLSPQASPLVINANGDPSRFGVFGLAVAGDVMEGHAGPLAGVLTGMRWSADNAPESRFIVTAACDTPFFPANLVETLLAAADGHYPVIALASSQNQVHPVSGLWPVSLAGDLEHALRSGMRKVLEWTGRHRVVTAGFAAKDGIDPFLNANTLEEFAKAEQYLMQGCGT